MGLWTAFLDLFTSEAEARHRRVEADRALAASRLITERGPTHVTYMDRLERGETPSLQDAIETWHDYARWPSRYQGVSLHEWLGMTWEEYSAWVESRKSPADILEDRRATQAMKVAEVAHDLSHDSECCDDH